MFLRPQRFRDPTPEELATPRLKIEYHRAAIKFYSERSAHYMRIAKWFGIAAIACALLGQVPLIIELLR